MNRWIILNSGLMGLGQAPVMALNETLSPFDVPPLVVQRLNNTLH